MNNWIQSILEKRERLAFPFVTHPGIEIIGETVKRTVSDGNLQYRAIAAAVKRFRMPACCAMMDLTVEAEAFGAQISMPDDEIPSVRGRLLNDAADVERLQLPGLDQGRLPAYLLANRLAVENISDVPFFSGCIGPFSLASRLYDMSELMMAIYTEPETVQLLLEKCTTFLLQYGRALKATGSAGVIVAEPAAGLLSNDDCLQFSTHYLQRVTSELQDERFTVILHNCGNSGHCTGAMIESGAYALHFGNAIEMSEVLKEVPPHILVMGNIDPVGTLRQSTPVEVKRKVTELLKQSADFPNFVISSGCDIAPGTPHENIDAFFEAVNRFNETL